jgi:hypothetical protein
MIQLYLPGDNDPIGLPLFVQAPSDGVEGTPNFMIVEGLPVLELIIYILYKKNNYCS